MAKLVRSISGDSRSFTALLVMAGALLSGTPAAAASKILNDKPARPDALTCAVDQPMATPISISRQILSGAPSALDRIRAEQQGIVGESADAPPPSVGPVPPSRYALLEPASRTAIYLIPPGAARCDAPDGQARDSMAAIAVPFTGDDASHDPDAELGTRAILVKHTPFDRRWEHVRRAAPTALMLAELRRANAVPGLAEQELLARVNQWVNRQIAYVNDDRNYRQRDFWATAEQTLGRGKGDCEDFAILKMQMLRAAGVDARRMKLVLLRDLAANADHAFLLVQTDAGKVVLDNMTDRVYDGSQSNAVRPVLSFSEGRRWVHAYRDTQPSPNFAAILASQKSNRLALNDQRSVKAEPLTFKTGFNK